MRIVQVTESLEIGGAERVVVTLANELARRGHDSSVVCLKTEGPLARDLAGVRSSCIGKGEGNDPRAILRLAAALRAAGAEVVHSHDWGCYLDTMMAAHAASALLAARIFHERTRKLRTLEGLMNLLKPVGR